MMLWPRPKQLTRSEGWHVVSEALVRALPDPEADDVLIREGIDLSLDGQPLTERGAQGDDGYAIEVTPEHVRLRAGTRQGLLHARATLLQLVEPGPEGPRLPCCHVVDWPTIRYRCASDWLLNCEINRWGYDWGDGPEAFLSRIKRKLDLCFRYKINQVWFDGFGWDVDRFPGYAELMRECSRYARRRGIRLTFAGYGGGYGTSYQQSELYRCGYQGQVFLNRRPWPGGEVDPCRGLETSVGRQYGSCLSNEGLTQAKLAEMREFVAAVEPGFMYIHDIDSGGWESSRQSWLMRCDECRRRWPSDEVADPRGMAGALAEWFCLVAQSLQQVRSDEYDPTVDLTLIFTSPLYGACEEPDEVWDREVGYFALLSELIGPVPGVQFGLREQFLRADGQPRVAQLARALDRVGHGHGAHVIAFGGGDNYYSSDLGNVSGMLAGCYEGAQSVCLSNGGVHEEPVQVLNAEWLWNGGASELALRPGRPAELNTALQAIRRGHYRPDSIFGETGLLREICQDLWGPEAGERMFRAYLCGGDSGNGPVSRVWWTVTREVRRLRGDPVEYSDWTWEQVAERWRERVRHTEEALAHVQAAADLTTDEDVRWLAQGLQIGGEFGKVVALLATHRHGGSEADRLAALEVLAGLQERLRSMSLQRTDLLGGDPGCWPETLDNLRALAQPEAHRESGGPT